MRLGYSEYRSMDGRGFSRAGKGFMRENPKGNTQEKPCHTEENSVLPDSLTQIYLFAIRLTVIYIAYNGSDKLLPVNN